MQIIALFWVASLETPGFSEFFTVLEAPRTCTYNYKTYLFLKKKNVNGEVIGFALENPAMHLIPFTSQAPGYRM